MPRTPLILYAALLIQGCSEIDEGPSPPALMGELARVETITGQLTDASMNRVARRVTAADAVYGVFRSEFVAATDALADWDDAEQATWIEDSTGWFTIYRECELGGEFELTGRFVGNELEPLLWGQLTECSFDDALGLVEVDAEFLVSLAGPGTLEEAALSESAIAVRGVVRSSVRDELLRVVYSARLADESRFLAALRGTSGDVHYEREDAESDVSIADVDDLWSCDLARRTCVTGSLKELSW